MKLSATLTAAVLLLFSTAFSQTKPVKKPALISFNINFSDYNLPRTIQDSGTSKAFQGKDWYSPGKKSFGVGVSWIKPLTKKIDFSANLSGTFSNFPALFVKGDSIGQAGFTPQLDALLHLNMFQPAVRVNPFLTAGVGAGKFGNQFAAYAPLGAGLKFKFHEGAFLIMQTQWRKKLMDGITNDYLFYQIGFTQTTGKKKKDVEVKSEPVTPIPADKDGDGVEDGNDECPDVKGTVKGCPDSDGDGVADKDDKCPNEKGTINGCPDSDGDGIPDKDDKCKDAAGLSRYGGCPIPDTDGDGINDEDDKCPNEKGTNNGCPEIKQEVKPKADYPAKTIYFNFASDELLKASLKTLDEVAAVLKEQADLKLDISAHADNRGTPGGNMMWSERRAQAVIDYFKSKGIDPSRITFKAYGDTQPADDNKTEKGRSKNRRAELKLDY
ncbi:MAG: OmpA family protein [Chitinophagaceae bacterium]|nr:OmpA family protein [Chitinophagaceae bacterium]